MAYSRRSTAKSSRRRNSSTRRSGTARRPARSRRTRSGSGGRRSGGGVIRIEIVNPTPNNLVPMQETAPKKRAKF